MKHTLNTNHAKGMTLMESLVALFILSLISVAILSSIQASTSATHTADVLLHLEELENLVIPKFTENPTIADLSQILPVGAVALSEDSYEAYYNHRLHITSDISDADYKVTFNRRLYTTPTDGFNIQSSEIKLDIDTYILNEESVWIPYGPSLSGGNSNVGILDHTSTPSIPDGGPIYDGTLTLEVHNATAYYKGKPVESPFVLSNIKPGVLLSSYMDDFTFIPLPDLHGTSPKYEIRNDTLLEGWETITHFDRPAERHTSIRVTFANQENLNLVLQIPSTLDSFNRTFSVTIDSVPFAEGQEELNGFTIASLMGYSTYDTIFKSTISNSEGEEIPLDYKAVEWIEISTGDRLRFEDIESGISLYTIASQGTDEPVIDKARFQNKTFIATAF